MVDTLQMTRSLGSYADVLADAGIVLEDVRDEARGIEIAYATDDSRRVVPRTLFVCKGAAFRREYLLQALAAGAVEMCIRDRAGFLYRRAHRHFHRKRSCPRCKRAPDGDFDARRLCMDCLEGGHARSGGRCCGCHARRGVPCAVYAG